MTRHQPEASVVIVSFNTRDILRSCLEALYRAIGEHPIEVVVVDNASRDGSADMVAAEFPAVQLVRSGINLGFAAGNNAAFGHARGRYVILLNPDTLVDREALDRAIAGMDAAADVGLAGGRLLNRRGEDEPAGEAVIEQLVAPADTPKATEAPAPEPVSAPTPDAAVLDSLTTTPQADETPTPPAKTPKDAPDVDRTVIDDLLDSDGRGA